MENNKQEIPKNNNDRIAISKSWGGHIMKPYHIKDIIWKSVESGKGGRTKNLRVYVRFFSGNYSDFLKNKREKIKDGRENEFKSKIDDYEFFFDEWEWGVVVYHTQDEEGTNKIEQLLRNHYKVTLSGINA